MNNTYKSEFEISLGGKEWLLKYDNNSIATVEDIYDNSIIQILAKPNFSKVALCFLAGLQWRKDFAVKKLNKEKVINMFEDFEDLTRVAELLGKAVVSALNIKMDEDPEDKEDEQAEGQEDSPPELTKALTGSVSNTQP